MTTALMFLAATAAHGQWQFRHSQPQPLRVSENAGGAPSEVADGRAGVIAAAGVTGGLVYQEVFSYDLGDYFCENHLAVADFNRDGLQDIVLVVTRPQFDARAILLRNQGDWTFQPSVIANYPGGYGYATAVADFNSDGFPDLLIRESHATHVLINDGRGGFNEASTFQPGFNSLAVLDMNRDGLPDVASGTQSGDGGLIELFGNVAGGRFIKAWESRLYGSDLDYIKSLQVANLNDDGVPDLLGLEIYGGLLVSLFGVQGSLSFVQGTVQPLGNRTFALAVGNIDRDRLTDVAVHVGWGQVRVFRNQGDGSLVDYWQSPDLGQAAFNLALQDFDGDGLDDLFVGTFGDGALRIYRNTPPGNFELAWTSSVPGNGYTGTASDLDGDGYPELIVGERNRIRILRNPSLNNPPRADASATKQTVIAPGKQQAAAVLDGSRSFDLDGDALRYLWLEDGKPLGQARVMTNLLAAGSHDLVLQVDDGRAISAHAVTIEVITPCAAMQRIANAIQDEARSKRHRLALLANLRMACYFAKDGRREAASDQLRVFQNKLRVLLAAHAPELASEWIRAAQDIRDALFSAIQFSAPSYVTVEGDPALAVTVLRLGDLSTTVTVQYRTVRGTALPGLDYVAQHGTLVFSPLESSQTIYLTTLRDGTPDGDETMRIILGRPTGGASLGKPRMTKVTIRDRERSIVWVLHDEDPDYRNPPFDDTLQALDEKGNVLASITGINTCQTIGGWRAITAVDQGQAVLFCDFCVNSSLVKYDLKGNKLFSIDRKIYAADVGASGTIYALTSAGTIDGESLLKISPDGGILAEAPVGGVDVVADERHQGIFVVGADLKYLDTEFNLLWTIDPINWSAVAVDVSSDGSAWVAERQHPNISSSADRLLHVSNEGQMLHNLPLEFSPSCVRVDPKDDSVYVAGGALAKYDRRGRLIFTVPFDSAEFQLYGFSLALDDVGNIWVGTWSDVRKYSPQGNLLMTTSRFAMASDTWISISHKVSNPNQQN